MQGGFEVRLHRSGRTLPIQGETTLRPLLHASTLIFPDGWMRHLRNQDYGRTTGSPRQLGRVLIKQHVRSSR
jgi:hypothetical protein